MAAPARPCPRCTCDRCDGCRASAAARAQSRFVDARRTGHRRARDLLLLRLCVRHRQSARDCHRPVEADPRTAASVVLTPAHRRPRRAGPRRSVFRTIAFFAERFAVLRTSFLTAPLRAAFFTALLDACFFAAAFLAAFLGTVCFLAACLRTGFLTAFFTLAFFAGAFFTTRFFAAALRAVFFAADFFAADFLAADFLG